MKLLMNYIDYISSTEDPSNFAIFDVPADNRCFYHACVLNLLYKADFNNISEPEDLVFSKDFSHTNTEEEVYFLELDDEYLIKACILLETRITEWIDNNRNYFFEEVGLTIDTLVQITHNIDIEDYVQRDILNSQIWAGLVEQIAFANIYGLGLTVYRPISYNKKYNRINEGIVQISNRTNKNVRFQLVQKISPYKSTTGDVYLLWKRYKGDIDHYMVLLNNLLS